jgi:hypothetical protein
VVLAIDSPFAIANSTAVIPLAEEVTTSAIYQPNFDSALGFSLLITISPKSISPLMPGVLKESVDVKGNQK